MFGLLLMKNVKSRTRTHLTAEKLKSEKKKYIEIVENLDASKVRIQAKDTRKTQSGVSFPL
jgi:hypothetical protein